MKVRGDAAVVAGCVPGAHHAHVAHLVVHVEEACTSLLDMGRNMRDCELPYLKMKICNQR